MVNFVSLLDATQATEVLEFRCAVDTLRSAVYDAGMDTAKERLSTKLTVIISAIALSVGIVIGAPAVVDSIAQPQPPSSSVLPAGPQPIGVVIRLYDTGPEFHLDDDHWEAGVDTARGVDIDAAGYLVIYTKEPNAVINCGADPDETLVARGITVGCSNGSHLIRLRFVKVGLDGQPAVLNLNNPVHYDRVEGDFSNIWFRGLHNGSWTP